MKSYRKGFKNFKKISNKDIYFKISEINGKVLHDLIFRHNTNFTQKQC